MSETKMFNEHNKQKISIRKTKNGESVVVISNLDSDHDITTVVDQLLSKKAFSDGSSIFVVVPTSDDNYSDLSSDCSTIGIVLSQHYLNWNLKQSNIEEPEILSRRNSSTTSSLKISANDKKYCMEGMQETIASFHENKSIYHQTLTNSCSHEKRKQKHCKISTSKQNWMLAHSISTDTTSDRPCCCAIEICGNHALLPEHPCVANVVSDLFTGFPENQGPWCPRYPGLHNPSDMLQIQDSTTMPLSVPETTKTVRGPNQSNSCRCSPDKLKELFQQVLTEMAPNFNSTVCGAAADNPPTYQAAICKKHFELVNSDSDNDEHNGNCSHHEDIKGPKLKCAYNDQSRTIRIQPFCPCERHKPLVTMPTAGPKAGTMSVGCQCCGCDEPTTKSGTISVSISMPVFVVNPSLGVLVPAGKVCQKETGEISCQAGQVSAPTSIDPKKPCKDCTCVKSKKITICEDPPYKYYLEPN